MRKLLTSLCAAAMSASFVAASFVPAQAAPVVVPEAPVASSDVINVQGIERQNLNSPGPFRIIRRNSTGFNNDGFYRNNNYRANNYRGGNYWYNGHRGYRDYRPGYRRYNGAWYPAAAFIAGAIVGGALNQGRVVQEGGDAHTAWCYDRYRSYRAYDNTYQPYNGSRKQCYSPYD